MLPISLTIFGKFSGWHIASIPLSLLFNLYYPTVLALHLTPCADLYDPVLLRMFASAKSSEVVVPMWIGAGSVALAFAAMRWKWAMGSLGVLGLFVAVSAVYQIA